MRLFKERKVKNIELKRKHSSMSGLRFMQAMWIGWSFNDKLRHFHRNANFGWNNRLRNCYSINRIRKFPNKVIFIAQAKYEWRLQHSLEKCWFCASSQRLDVICARDLFLFFNLSKFEIHLRISVHVLHFECFVYSSPGSRLKLLIATILRQQHIWLYAKFSLLLMPLTWLTDFDRSNSK